MHRITLIGAGFAALTAARRVRALAPATECVFHTKLDTDSTGNWTLIPCQTGQGFQGNLDT